MTHISQGFVITGELTADEDLRFDGSLHGQPTVEDGTLTLGQTATVTADIRAAQVVVHGTVRGSIAARHRLELAASARVTGSLTAERIVIADGARFDGDVYMGRQTIARMVVQYRQDQVDKASRL